MDSNVIKSEFSFEKLNYRSVSDLVIDRLKHNSDDICIIDCSSDRKWTKGQVLDSCQNFAYYLINDCKLSKGDVVCFVCNTSDIHAFGLLGVFLAGGVYCSLFYDSTEDEIQSYFQAIKPSIVVCIESKYEFIKTLSKESLIKKIVLIGETVNKRNECQSIEEIIKIQRKADIELPVTTGLNETASVVMTSGSTGKPKAVNNTNGNLMAFVEVVQHREIVGITADMRVMSMPFVYKAGQIVLLAALVGGGQLAVLNDNETIVGYLHKIHDYSVTNLWTVPTQLNHMVTHWNEWKGYLKSVKYVFTGGAPLSASTHAFIVNECRFQMFSRGYGMAEVGLATQVPASESQRVTDRLSVGKVCPNTEIKVVDEMGNSLPANTTGEICIRGAQVTPGYLNSSEENAKLFTSDSFLKSGDIGYYDENNDFFIVGRIKDIIKYHAVIVAPAELENILVSHPQVVNAAVVGIPSEESGEVPMAFVTVAPNAMVTVPELIEYVNSRVNKIKQLRGGLKIVDAFPLSPRGKILKQVLKTWI